MCHAREILKVISKVFNDVATGMQLSEPSTLEENDYDFDDELLDEWNEFLQDDDLFDMILDNLSLSQIDDSLLQQEPVCNSQEIELPLKLECHFRTPSSQIYNSKLSLRFQVARYTQSLGGGHRKK